MSLMGQHRLFIHLHHFQIILEYTRLQISVHEKYTVVAYFRIDLLALHSRKKTIVLYIQLKLLLCLIDQYPLIHLNHSQIIQDCKRSLL
jgi:hypothetical protein